MHQVALQFLAGEAKVDGAKVTKHQISAENSSISEKYEASLFFCTDSTFQKCSVGVADDRIAFPCKRHEPADGLFQGFMHVYGRRYACTHICELCYTYIYIYIYLDI